MDSAFAPEFWHWLVLGVILVTVEIFVPGAFFLGMGVAAGVVGIVVLAVPDIGLGGQVFAFALLSLIAVALLRRLLKHRPIETEQPLLNQRGQQYVGRTFTLTGPIVNGHGKIRVDDSTWKIAGPDCDVGTRVHVSGVDGVVLQVTVEEQAA